MSGKFNRRDFLRALGVGTGTVGAAFLGGAWPTGTVVAQEGTSTLEPWQDMDIHHEEGVNVFLEQIGADTRFWERDLEYTMDGDVKVFELTCNNVQWESDTPGLFRPAFAYNNTIPGPTIRATQGDRVRVIVHNEMDQSTSVHWHGLDIPNDQDGVTYVNQQPIRPHETFTYEFTLENYGSHMYHSHHNSMEQVVGGLLGAFIVEPNADHAAEEPAYDKEYIYILNDSLLGFTVNGKGFPYTQPLTAKVGERIRIRFYNEGLMIHPMHMHGMPMEVFAKDGYVLPAPYKCDVINIAPGERYDVIVTARAAGLWALHCHILSHVEGRNGMFGMVTVFVVEPAEE
jgi:FtsP/CotA-like multicopper oxidase with cupredoxin domain